MPFEQAKCDVCEELEAKIMCPQCDEKFCTSCDEKRHTISKKFQTHSRSSFIGEVTQSRFCEIKGHEGIQISLYCDTCNSLMCGSCSIEKHSGHKGITLKSAVEKVKFGFEDNISIIKGEISNEEKEIKIVEEEIKAKEKILQERKKMLAEKLQVLDEVKGLMSKSDSDAFTFLSIASKLKLVAPNVKPLGSLLSYSSLKLLCTWLNNKQVMLIYDASKNGFTATDFYRHCTGKAPTLTVIKVKETQRVFGGFTTVPWTNSGGYKTDHNAFLFSQSVDGKTLRKFSVNNPQYAVSHDFGRGIDFGGGGNVCCLQDGQKPRAGRCWSAPGYYRADDDGEFTDRTLAGLRDFEVEEVRIFLVQ